MYTPQQENLKARIESLLRMSPDNIRIKVVESDERNERGGSPKTGAIRNGTKVSVILVEAYSSTELEEWSAALDKADELTRLIEQENLHYANNPNFSKAMSFIVNKLQHPGLYA